VNDAVIWHDLECASYSVDLPLWRELAERAEGRELAERAEGRELAERAEGRELAERAEGGALGRVLDLGAGTGRVTLDLAERGHAVTAVDSDPLLLDELRRRAEEADLEVTCIRADAQSLPEMEPFALAIAPMQFLQIMGGAAGRGRLLGGVAHRLAPDGLFAAAVTDLDEAVAPEDAPAPLPDVTESGHWVFSSIPLDVRPHPRGILVEWLRQKVSPAGELTEESHTQVLEELTPDQLEAEVAEHGFRVEERRELAPTRDYVGSTVVICRR
jgi:SAM-dependent methyltransferase